MARPSTDVRCPSCGESVPTRLVTDGGASVAEALDAPDGLLGREVRCERCDSSFEVLFYPR
jgi:ribosomal protein S27E